METASWNITVTRGEDHDRTMSLAIDGVPVNLTGYSARMQVRSGQDETAALITELSTSNGMLAINGSAGTIRRQLTHTQTAALPKGSYWFDLLLSSPTDFRTYMVRGGFHVGNRITA